MNLVSLHFYEYFSIQYHARTHECVILAIFKIVNRRPI